MAAFFRKVSKTKRRTTNTKMTVLANFAHFGASRVDKKSRKLLYFKSLKV